MNIKIGDLVKLNNTAEQSYGAQFGTVVEKAARNTIQSPNEVKVMMYAAGLGQFTQWIHLTRLERVTPVEEEQAWIEQVIQNMEG